MSKSIFSCFFFFQAEDGIRDGHVTGVQTCALPILGRSARTSWPCETFASSNRSRSLNDCDCAVMRASIRHLLLNVVVRAAGSESSLTGGSREPGAGSGTQPCDWSGVLYTVGLVDAPRLMPIRPRLTRPPRILIASDQ